MRFLWFLLIPYPDLPEDVELKLGRVWVDVDPQRRRRDRR